MNIKTTKKWRFAGPIANVGRTQRTHIKMERLKLCSIQKWSIISFKYTVLLACSLVRSLPHLLRHIKEKCILHADQLNGRPKKTTRIEFIVAAKKWIEISGTIILLCAHNTLCSCLQCAREVRNRTSIKSLCNKQHRQFKSKTRNSDRTWRIN